ncbi:MAG: DUF4115 domain-containing protein [Alphaproteobacteria bacterium]|nr:DUF4115 domain-containing protein [Alphaproteobacteria bacterium]
MSPQSQRRSHLQEVTPEAQAAGEIEAGYQGVGALLRAARLRAGLDLLTAGERLNIKPQNLEAIERGRFDLLPGPAYASGFLRSYGIYLGLDPNAVLQQFRDEVEAPKLGPLIFPQPTPEGRLPSRRLIVTSLLAALVLYLGYVRFLEPERAPAPLVAAVPDRLMPLARTEAPIALPPPATPSMVAVAPTPAPVPAPAPPAPVAEVAPAPPVSAPTVAAVEPAPAAPTPAAPTPAATEPPQVQPAATSENEPAEPTGKLYGAENKDGRVLLVARMDSWIQVRGGGRDIVFSRTLRAGDTFRVPNRKELVLFTGNAGGLEVSVDGRPIPPIGGIGMVKRDVPLDPVKLMQGERE